MVENTDDETDEEMCQAITHCKAMTPHRSRSLSSAAARPTTARPSASFSTGSRARRGYVGRAKVQLCHAVDGLLRALAALGRTEERARLVALILVRIDHQGSIKPRHALLGI